MAGALGDRGIVGEAKLARLRGHGVGLLDQRILEALRRLHRPQIGAIDSARNNAARRPLHRIADGKAGDHARMVGEAANDPVDEFGRHKGPGGIVDEHMSWDCGL